MIHTLTFDMPSQGLHEITAELLHVVHRTGLEQGLCTVFIQHTSASLLIQENADYSAKRDLERWLCRLVREDDPHFTHTSEGADDMPSHIKSALTATSLGIPILGGTLALGRWQGVYIWEHRTQPHRRTIVMHLCGDNSKS